MLKLEEFNVPEIQSILKSRNLGERQIAGLFETIDIFNPKVKYFKEAFNLLVQYIMANKLIMVFHDVDLDGLESGNRMVSLCSSLGAKVIPVINEKKSHGLNSDIVQKVIQHNIGLLVAVDSSINDTEYIKQLNNNGIAVLVLDHHIIEPDTDLTPTPMRVLCNCKNLEPDETRDFTEISAGMLCYYFSEYCYKQLGKSQDDYIDTFDLSAITIYSDFCNLANTVNRNIVHNLLSRTKFNNRISAFLDTDEKDKQVYLTSTDIGFKIAPAYNSMIRTGSTNKAMQMVNTVNPAEFSTLKDFSLECTKLQQDLVLQLSSMCEIYDLGKFELANLDKADLGKYNSIKTNFTGLLASRIKAIHKKPIIVAYSDPENNQLKGSFRGISGIKYKQLMEQSGMQARGHEIACGVFIPIDRLSAVSSNLNKLFPDPSSISKYDREYTPIQARVKSKEIELFARFNELAGAGLDKIKIKLSCSKGLLVKEISDKLSIIDCDGLEILSFGNEHQTESALDSNKNEVIVVPSVSYYKGQKTYKFILEQ